MERGTVNKYTHVHTQHMRIYGYRAKKLGSSEDGLQFLTLDPQGMAYIINVPRDRYSSVAQWPLAVWEGEGSTISARGNAHRSLLRCFPQISVFLLVIGHPPTKATKAST